LRRRLYTRTRCHSLQRLPLHMAHPGDRSCTEPDSCAEPTVL